MSLSIAIANRKGGVGKSTIATMLAYGFSAFGRKRVLVIDLDVQCNSSLILIGGRQWRDARNQSRTIADYFDARFDHTAGAFEGYMIRDAGDIHLENTPPITLLPGAVTLEDIENELLHRVARQMAALPEVERAVASRLKRLLSELHAGFDIVIYDCPPGLSFAAKAAIALADKVLVPFKPDFVSQNAVDRISLLIENRANLTAITQLPKTSRRYAAIGNFYDDADAEQIEIYQEVAAAHPVASLFLPPSPDIASAFSWSRNKRPLRQKFGLRGSRLMEDLHKETDALLIGR